jgi:outer membrane protein assembly factor BamB
MTGTHRIGGTMSVIELGDVSEPVVGEPADEPPFRFDRRAWSRTMAVVLAVLCAVGLTGSGRPVPPGMRQLWSMQLEPDQIPTYSGDEALLFRSGAEGATLTAYDVRTGSVRWTTVTGSEPTWVIPRPDAGLLYVPGRHERALADDGFYLFATETLALDEATGAIRWRHSGQYMGATADTVLLADWNAQAQVTTLHLVRAADGAPVWDRSIDPATAVTAAEDLPATDQIVAMTADGRLTTYRYSDGTPLATRHTTPPVNARWMSLLYAGRYYEIGFGGRQTVIAYRADTLARLWDVTQPDQDLFLMSCGPVVCMAASQIMHGLDPATGESRWVLPQTGATSIGGNRLLVTPAAANSTTVVDATTGRAVSAKIKGTVLTVPQADGTLLVLRPSGYPDLRTAVSRLDPVTGRTLLLGSVPGLSNTCEPVAGYLACVRADRELVVTSVG